MKAKVTWKGEEGNSAKETTWAKQTFKKDEAVEVTDPEVIRRAQGNQFFDVQVTEQDEEEQGKPTLQKPPSNTTSPQHPAPKGGEPVSRTETGAPKR